VPDDRLLIGGAPEVHAGTMIGTAGVRSSIDSETLLSC